MKIIVLCYIEVDAEKLQCELNEAYDRKRVEAHNVLSEKRLYRFLFTQKVSKGEHLNTIEDQPQVITYGIEQSLGIHYAYSVKYDNYQKVIVRRKDLNIAESDDTKKEQEHYCHSNELGYSNSKTCDIKRKYDITGGSENTEPDKGVDYGRPFVETRKCEIHIIKDPSPAPEYSS